MTMRKFATALFQASMMAAISLATIAATSALLHARADEEPEEVTIDPSRILSSPTLAFTNLQSLAWNNVTAGPVTINAALDFKDAADSVTLYWRLVVYAEPRNADGTYTEVFAANYTNQAFNVPANTQVTPTFSETVSLAPGTYSVKVSVVESVAVEEFGGPVIKSMEVVTDLADLNVTVP
jgi:hypothetical protein